MGALNRTVVAPLSSAIITVMVAGLVVAAVDNVDRNNVKEGTARLEATGLVEVSVAGAPFVRASHGRTLGAHDHVRVIDVAATPNHQGMSEYDIDNVLVEQARAGRRVARLLDGDPLLFSRAGDHLRWTLAR